MIKLLCEENNLEYTGAGYLQCGRHVDCPKKKNNKILGFDCIIYIDNLPNGCKIDIPEKEPININDNLIKIDYTQDINKGHIVANKNRSGLQIIPASEQISP